MPPESEEDINLPPNPAGMIEGLRDTGYTFNTALADIVDNSIDAGARDIAVRIEMDLEGNISITVADNGCGMTLAGLKNAMTYGTRSEGRESKRLGKFGLGLKTASTAFCRKLSVVSRANATEASKLTWDLDYVVSSNNWSARKSDPTPEDLAIINQLAANASGTLVSWEKVDRLIKTYDDPSGPHARRAVKKVAEEFIEHAASVYQHFLEAPQGGVARVKMTVNGTQVVPWDPFRMHLSEKVYEKVIAVEKSDRTGVANFTFRAFVLPHRDEILDPAELSLARLKAENQGIYVYREGRLIHAGDWMGMYSIEPHMTLLRAELSFNHDLDDAFNVDIKKSQITLDEAFFDALKKLLTAPRRAAEERYRRGTGRAATRVSGGAHAASNATIASKQSEVVTAATASVTSVDAARGTAEVSNRQGTFVIKLPTVDPTSPDQVHVQAVESINDGLLWTPVLLAGKHAVQINMGHDYYKKVYLPAIGTDRSTVKGMDFLLWSLGEAELSATSESTQRHFKELRYEVSRLLRVFVEDLPDPEINA
jgi:hypothetical protein